MAAVAQLPGPQAPSTLWTILRGTGLRLWSSSPPELWGLDRESNYLGMR